MKQLLIIAVAFIAINCSGQSIDMDNNGMYAEIQPKVITWVNTEYALTRLYLNVTGYSINSVSGRGLVNYRWWLMYATDSAQTRWERVGGTLGEGIATATIGDIGVSLRDATLKLFMDVADSTTLNIIYK